MNKNQHNEYLVSVIIPSYNSADTIEKTLSSLSNQKGEFKYEIIVVDSSDDLTPSVICKKFLRVTLIRLKNRTPAGKARNLGAKNAAGKYIAFLDSDCFVENHWLESMLNAYSKEYCAVGGPIENANPENLVSFAGHILEFSEFYTKKDLLTVDHIPSGNVLFLKSAFIEIGGYPDKLFPQEDRFFSWKLKKETGKNLVFHPDIKVKHCHRIMLKDFLNHQFCIGSAGAKILQNTDLRGSDIIKNKWLVNILLPVFPAIKLFRSLRRTLRWKPMELLSRPHVIPILCLGMFFWMLGFARQANRKK